MCIRDRSERQQGLGDNLLSANTSAQATNQVMTAAQQRIELIARVFGETGLTDLYRLMYKLVIQNQTSTDIFRLRDEYVEVDPSSWVERKDTSVVVGLGNGSRDSEMMQLNMIFQNQQALLQNPTMAPLVQDANVYNTLEDQVKVFNKAASGRYFTDPTSEQGQQIKQQAQQSQQQQAQAQQQAAQQQLQLQQQALQNDTQRVEIERLKAQITDQNDKTGLDIKQQGQRLDEQEHEDNTALATAELQLEAKIESEQGRPVALGR
jgi:hypothetical protein